MNKITSLKYYVLKMIKRGKKTKYDYIIFVKIKFVKMLIKKKRINFFK